MEPKAKYFPQTTAALQVLQETAALLEQSASHSATQNQELSAKLTNLRQQIADKTTRIDTVIATLSKAVK